VKRRHFISLGSNLGNREKLLDRALQKMHDLWGMAPLVSNRYNTPPWGMPDGTPDFLNQVVMLSWANPPEPLEIMRALLNIEKELGRGRDHNLQGYQSRTIDLDLLSIDGVVRNSPELTLPHPRMHLRKFILIPMAELAEDARPNPNGPTVAELLHACEDVSFMQRLKKPGIQP
jgi:2-amino-4-hydroxy-6-hydroxymethyldihydropteridine diphosphokinase